MISMRYWLAYFLGTLMFFYAFIQRVSTSVITDELMRSFAAGGAAVGVLSGMYFYTYSAMQLPVGLLVDRFGPRKLLAISALVCALASVAFAHSDTLLLAAVSRGLVGAAVAFPFVCTLAILTMFFTPRQFPMLTGLVMSVGMCGAVVGQAPLRLLLEYLGWRQIFDLLAVLALVLAVAAWFIVPRREKAVIERSAKTADSQHSVLRSLLVVVGNRNSWYCTLAGFGLSATMLSFAGLWAVPWLGARYAFSVTQSGVIASFLFIGWAVGAPVLGEVAERLQRGKPVIIVSALLSMVCLWLLVYRGWSSTWALSALFFLTGFFSSAMVITFVLIRALNGPSHQGTALGFVNMGVVGAGAIMQPLLGVLLDWHWDGTLVNQARVYTPAAYEHAVLSLMAVILMAVICMVLVEDEHTLGLRSREKHGAGRS